MFYNLIPTPKIATNGQKNITEKGPKKVFETDPNPKLAPKSQKSVKIVVELITKR